MRQGGMEAVDYSSVAAELAGQFAATAVERDAQGGTPLHERDLLRQSGLLRAVIPTGYGGDGATWTTVLAIVGEFAKVDSSLAHVFAYHHVGLVTPHFYGTPAQKERYYTETARHNWFWGNAVNPLDRRVRITADGRGYRLNGTKSFCSGARDSDMMPVTALGDDATLAVAIVPTARRGVLVNDDWHNMGQRQTDSGSVTFEDVRVEPDEVLEGPGSPASPFATLRTCLIQITLTTIYLGIAQGAFEAARQYTATGTWPAPGRDVDSAAQDPYILRHYGEMWTGLQAAAGLVAMATGSFEGAWQQGEGLTAEGRGECALAVATAKIAATRTGLEITNRIFEVMGARATAARYGFDRYWRNLRTLTLHDPLEYKLREVGNWALNGQLPDPGYYS